jgi:ParB family transcriptional regulator, chromosome partitioning protein
VSKEKRLGRGLEALLGQISVRNESVMSTQNNRAPGEVVATIGQIKDEPIGVAPHPRTGPPPDFFDYPGGNSLPAISTPIEHPAAQTIGQSPIQTAPQPQKEPPRLRIDLIDSNPDQPRQDFDSDDIQKLSESISAHGLLQPIVVRRINDRYQIIAGERRMRAAVQAGWRDVPVNIIEADDRQTAELAIVENLQRKDLNALEKAACFQRYLEQYGSTQEELASRLNMDRSTIANMIRLLELPAAVQESLRRGDLTPGHARALLPLGDEREQINFAARIKREGLNVRQTETLVQQMIDAADHEPLAVIDREGRSTKISRGQNEQVAALEQEFRAALGLKKVQITSNARGRGKLVIHFRDYDEFDRVREHICGDERSAERGKAV